MIFVITRKIDFFLNYLWLKVADFEWLFFLQCRTPDNSKLAVSFEDYLSLHPNCRRFLCFWKYLLINLRLWFILKLVVRQVGNFANLRDVSCHYAQFYPPFRDYFIIQGWVCFLHNYFILKNVSLIYLYKSVFFVLYLFALWSRIMLVFINGIDFGV